MIWFKSMTKSAEYHPRRQFDSLEYLDTMGYKPGGYAFESIDGPWYKSCIDTWMEATVKLSKMYSVDVIVIVIYGVDLFILAGDVNAKNRKTEKPGCGPICG